MMARMDEAVMRVANAWLVAGPHPDYHEAQVRRLFEEWPTLARAVEDLTLAATGHVNTRGLRD